MKKILFIEDNEQYRNKVTEWLTEDGYEVCAVDNPITAMDVFQDDEYDLIVSDYMMEPMSGIQVLKYLRRINLHVHSILLTGLDSSEVELQALNISVDQFLRKDVSKEVFLKYVDLVLQREIVIEPKKEDDILTSTIENIILDTRRRELRKDGKMIELTNKHFRILKKFLENKGEIITREDFLEDIWCDDKDEVTSRVVDTHVKLLRKNLKVNTIQSVRGIGYKWVE